MSKRTEGRSKLIIFKFQHYFLRPCNLKCGNDTVAIGTRTLEVCVVVLEPRWYAAVVEGMVL